MMSGRAAIAASIVTVAFATHPRAQEKQAPTFRTGVEAVSLDVSVLDKHRRPVTGLTADDFTILEDGHVRPVIAFAAVDALASSKRLRQFPSSLPIGSVDPEAASPGRIVGIIMPFAIQNERTVMARQLARTVVNQLEPDDLAMVIYPGRAGSWTATSDKTALLKQVENPEFPFGATGNQGRDICGTDLFDAMSTFAESVRDISTRRKVMFMVGPAPVFTVQNECAARLAAARERVFHDLRVSNVTVYTFDAAGLETLAKDARVGTREGAQSNGRIDRTGIDQAHMFRQGNYQVLPDMTGGRAIINTNTPGEFIPDIFAETSSYYVVGFQPASPSNPGTHKIAVNVSRADVHVVARTQWDAR
jgi:VWFA-related protein